MKINNSKCKSVKVKKAGQTFCPAFILKCARFSASLHASKSSDLGL